MPGVCIILIIIIFIVDGGWSSWVNGSCSKTCGGGIKHDTRVCDNPRPSCGGKKCEGPSTHSSTCNEICCPGNSLSSLQEDSTKTLIAAQIAGNFSKIT